MKTIKIIITALIFLFLLLPFTWQYLEEPHSFYQAYTEELHSGNWVPRIFPKDIVNIHEQHVIDANEVWVRFERRDNPVSTDKMKKLSNSEKEQLRYKRPYFASWWFDGLIEQQPEIDSALNADVFQGACGENMTSFLAISKTDQYVYWWCQ